LLVKARKSGFSGLNFQKHNKRAKRRAMGILNARTKKDRSQHYKDLLKVTKKTVGYIRTALPVMESLDNVTSFQQFLDMLVIVGEMRHYLPLADQVISQAERRVIFGEQVPAEEKIVSIFEEHTSIIIKDRRETYFGHKICLTGGRSNLILDCQVLDGNPTDSTLTLPMLDRQNDIYSRYPLKAAFDGGFASKDNVVKARAEGRGVKDICFSKKRGIKVGDMCRSEYVYKRLRNFRAGIESGISWLKRSFGLGRCNWKGWESFKSYVWASVVSANLLTLARVRLA
jgi:IS5 family transposase